MKDKRKWHLLSPEDYDKVFSTLSSKYPNLFIKDKVFILKRGLHQDIFNSGELEFSKTVIRKFLKLYTEQAKYIELHIEKAQRYDLEGNEAGLVTKEDIVGLTKKKDEIKNHLALKKKKKSEKIKFDDASKGGKPKNSSKKLEVVNTNGKKPKLGLNIEAGNKNG